MIAQFHHVPVLAEPTIAGLEIVSDGVYLDCTIGGGGHSDLILQAAENVRLVGIDRDEMAIAAAGEKLADYQNQVTFWRGNFFEYKP
jgi:16S rRNA (cytosine1402-N4)-methyltransferase